MKKELSPSEFAARFEVAFKRRAEALEEGGIENAVCEVCGDRIPSYDGPRIGIMCHDCLENTRSWCGRIEPLTITRSPIREARRR